MTNTAQKGPTVKQAVTRLVDTHVRVLRCARDGHPVRIGAGESVSSGYRLNTALRTLLRWGAVEQATDGPSAMWRLTDFGRDVMALLPAVRQ